MPHVSHKETPPAIKKKLEDLLWSLFNHPSSLTRRAVLQELFTPTERLMFAKRLMLLSLIEKEVPLHTIVRMLRMSPSTIAIFENHCDRGKFKKTRAWLKRNELGLLLNTLINILSIPLTKSYKGTSKLLDPLP